MTGSIGLGAGVTLPIGSFETPERKRVQCEDNLNLSVVSTSLFSIIRLIAVVDFVVVAIYSTEGNVPFSGV